MLSRIRLGSGRKPTASSEVRSKCTGTSSADVRAIKRSAIHPVIDPNVGLGSYVHTDALRSYIGPDRDFVHQLIDHAE